MSANGVFSQTVNESAFVDKASISIRGSRREDSQLAVRDKVNRATGGPGQKYARTERAILLSSGNSFDLTYGPMRLIGILPPLVLTVRSDETPVTIVEIEEVIDGICNVGWKECLSTVELTFDFTGLSTDWFWFRVCSSAHNYKTWPDKNGADTYYIGGRTSPWQEKIYQKTSKVTRFEIVLRRPFLRQHGITEIGDLKKLSTLDFGRRLQFRELNQAGLKSLARRLGKPEDRQRRALADLARTISYRDLDRAAKKLFHAASGELLAPSPIQERIRRMQELLVI
jgi:hypothetical protein